MPARIVIVLDDTSLGDLAVEALEALGHEAMAIHDPMVALEVLESPQRIEMLVTSGDFAGRGKPNGLSLARMTRQKRPELKAVFLGPAALAGIVGQDGVHLATPTTASEIARTVAGMMGSGAG